MSAPKNEMFHLKSMFPCFLKWFTNFLKQHNLSHIFLEWAVLRCSFNFNFWYSHWHRLFIKMLVLFYLLGGLAHFLEHAHISWCGIILPIMWIHHLKLSKYNIFLLLICCVSITCTLLAWASSFFFHLQVCLYVPQLNILMRTWSEII